MMVKVRAVMDYYDKQLGFYKEKDEIIEVSEERAEQLINAGVAEMTEESDAVSQQEKAKPKRRTAKKTAK